MIVLVTGAGGGIGKAIARSFIEFGHHVILTGRVYDQLLAIAKQLGGGDRVLPLALDVTDRYAVEATISALPDAFAAIDVLVNNAGVARGLEPAHQCSLDDWDRMVDTNAKGVMYVTHAVLPGMVRRNRGHIVNMGSIAGNWPYPGGNIYGATKAFVRQLSLNLRADLIGTSVRVTDIEPGLVGGTNFSVTRFRGDQAKAAAVYQGSDPLTADDVADAVYWVATRPARVNVNTIEIMPVCQAFAPFAVNRSTM